MKSNTQDILAVIIGSIAIIATGALLFPIMKMLLTQNLRSSILQGLRISFFDVNLYGFLWIGVSCFVGGFITCWIAVNKRLFYVLITGLLFFLAILVINIVKGDVSLWACLVALAFVPFTFMGGIVRRMVENNKKV